MGLKMQSSGRRSNKKSKEKKNKEREIPKVQVLYNTCKEVFENCGPGIVPTPENVQRLKDVMDSMTEADVGLRQTMQIFQPRYTEKFPRMSYIRIYECDKFSIGLFCLPPSAVIPLHNHPQMTVFCKLLFGQMYVNSFDWVDVNSPNEDGIFSARPLKTVNSAKLESDFKANSANEVTGAGAVRLAKTKADHIIEAPSNTSVLYPADGGNIHTISARTACAFLDVLGPPYSDPDGRHCSYYRHYPFTSLPAAVEKNLVPIEHRQDYAWLEETENAQGSLLYGKSYTGPEIVTE